MKEIEEIDEKKTKQIIKKLEDLIVSRDEMHKLKENAIKFKKVQFKGKLYSQAEKIKSGIEDIKVPTLQALEDE